MGPAVSSLAFANNVDPTSSSVAASYLWNVEITHILSYFFYFCLRFDQSILQLFFQLE